MSLTALAACDDDEIGGALSPDAQAGGGGGGGIIGGTGGVMIGGAGGAMGGAGGEVGGAGGAVGGAGGEPGGAGGAVEADMGMGDPDAGDAPDTGAGDPDMGPGRPDAAVPPGPCALPETGPTDGLWFPESITEGPWQASLAVDDADPCRRVFTLSSDLPRRDALPLSPRGVDEGAPGPRLRSGHPFFDALYALARVEVQENAVDAIRDGAFREGDPVACPEGGCFETGRKWNYVWTRDTAYAVDLSLAMMDPVRSTNSLDFKLSERREGGDLQIVQDTGSGGSYPVSSDRVVWSMGARSALAWLEGPARDAFATRTLDAAINTLEHDRAVVYDPEDGLYRGEQSFLDWREQSYPRWVEGDVVHIAMSKALSTNVGHLSLMRLAAELAEAQGDDAAAARYGQWADELSSAIQTRLYLPEEGMYSTFVTTGLDSAPARHFDLLGSALAILHGVATPAQARSMLDQYPHTAYGPPVIWPQQQWIPIYHNRGLWPFVTAYWIRAAAHMGHAATLDHNMQNMMKAAALNLSNMENFEATTGLPFVADGDASGPVVNSQRQLWSVAGYLSMVHDVVFGLQWAPPQGPLGIKFKPAVTAWMREQLFGATDEVVLEGLAWQGRSLIVKVALPAQAGPGGILSVDGVQVNGTAVDAEAWLGLEDLPDGATVTITLGSSAGDDSSIIVVDAAENYRDYFAPQPPEIEGVSAAPGGLQLNFNAGGEQPGDVTFTLYRDGVQVASGVSGDTTSWVDEAAQGDTVSHCYSAELTFTRSGHTGQRSAPYCWWGAGFERITTFNAAQLSNVGGQGVNNHGRFHYENWGDPGHSLTAEGVTAEYTGTHVFQVTFGNGAGAVNTGVTCSVKRLEVFDLTDNRVAGEGYLIMPHLGVWDRWEDSNFVPVDLEAGHTYRVTIDGGGQAINMSSFAHFETYTGGLGGVGGVFNRVNIAELKMLSLSGRQ
ncbi:MAG: MGH1-like glycoside hydrolase domain-containing protein [Bradymonadia bacterium]